MSIRNFFSPQRVYAVVGASSNSSKFGYKVLKWYVDHELPVVPVNPTSSSILDLPVSPTLIDAISYIKGTYPDNDGVSVSFITPPSVTYDVLESVEDAGLQDVIKAVWFQPGAYDSAVISKARELKINPIIEHGDCILASGGSFFVESKL